MATADTGKWFPPPNPTYGMPFYYASLMTYWVYYQVDVDLLKPHVGDQYVPTVFDGQGLVLVNPQLYTSSFNNGQELTTETEFNIVVHPRSEQRRAPTGLSLTEYLSGADQTKLIGNLRLHVACDDPVAVAAGREVFGEPKFVTTFDYDVPSINAPGQETWQWRCNDPEDKSLFIFDLELKQLSGTPSWVNPSPITGYTYLDGRGVGSRWNPFAPVQQFMLQPSAAMITFGASTHPMRADMQRIIGTTPAVAMQVSVSPPACIESGPFYVDPGGG